MNGLTREDKLVYGAVFCGTLWAATVAFPLELRHLAGLGFGSGAVYWLYSQKSRSLESVSASLHTKLNAVIAASSVQPRKGNEETDELIRRAGIKIDRVDNSITYIPQHLYKDPDLVQFLYSILDFREYNHPVFLDMVWTLDNLVAVHEEIKIGVSNCTVQAQEARKYADLAMNHYRSFRLALPVIPIVETKFENKERRLHTLVLRHMDDIHRLCRTQTKHAPQTRTGYDNPKMARPNDLADAGVSLQFNQF